MNVNIALLTVTDTRTLKTDKSGNILVDKIKIFITFMLLYFSMNDCHSSKIHDT